MRATSPRSKLATLKASYPAQSPGQLYTLVTARLHPDQAQSMSAGGPSRTFKLPRAATVLRATGRLWWLHGTQQRLGVGAGDAAEGNQGAQPPPCRAGVGPKLRSPHSCTGASSSTGRWGTGQRGWAGLGSPWESPLAGLRSRRKRKRASEGQGTWSLSSLSHPPKW